MGAAPTPRDSQNIPIDPNRRPADDPRFQPRRTEKKRPPQIGGDDDPYLPRMPKQYPEPTD